MKANVLEISSKSNNSKKVAYEEAIPSLDTLAQLGTNKILCRDENEISDSECFDIQSLTSLDDKKALVKRARRKYFTDGLLKALVDAARLNNDSKLRKAYWNTYYCAKNLTLTSDGKISGRYCKNKWCMVCNSIRTAQLINEYSSVLQNWQDKHVVTLTIPNCSANSLPHQLVAMKTDFSTIYERLRKQAMRGQRQRFKGLRKLECTYNVERNDFHPHFHVIVEGEENATALQDYWLQTTFLTDPKAQDVRKADDAATMELFKYFTKVISGKSKDKRMIYADALDVIFNAVRGIRTFQSFGFEQIDRDILSEARNTLTAELRQDENIIAVDSFEWALNDWYSATTGEALTNYQPGEGMKDLVEVKTVVRKTWDRSPRKYTGKKNEPTTSTSRLPDITKLQTDPRIIGDTAKRARSKVGLNSLKDREVLIIPFI